ncbi:MAG: efflux RND transporter periplasmic adaptor subunit [Bacteroidia bacterium]|nr:efflux RND transporter periplasmic adaptor subunit [Bacteroidia bacterium]
MLRKKNSINRLENYELKSIFKLSNFQIFKLNRIFKLLFVVLIVLQSCSGNDTQTQSTTTKKIPLVKIQVVEETEIVSYIDITGTIEANIFTDIVASTDGIIEILYARENQTVYKDNIIAVINPNNRVSIISKNKLIINELNTKIKKADTTSVLYDSLQIELENANKNLAYAENMYQTIPIICPMTGLVTQRHTDIGNQVNIKDKILTISDMNSLVVKAEINEKYFENIKKGDKLTLMLNAYPNDTLTGIITLIYPQIDPVTRNVKFDIKIQNFSKTLIPGMLAYIKIPVASNKNAITVPEQAVLTSPDNKNFVFTVNTDTIARKIMVVTGISSGNNIEITKGLKPKEKVVISGQEMLKDSIKVKIIK